MLQFVFPDVALSYHPHPPLQILISVVVMSIHRCCTRATCWIFEIVFGCCTFFICCHCYISNAASSISKC
uniref:Uncharacterized protein n=1 Tax=Arundo donax TaxID=35708 RepID=A0A0A8ZD27_ARUDO